MRATDIIRNVLDIIDGIDEPEEQGNVDATVTIAVPGPETDLSK